MTLGTICWKCHQSLCGQPARGRIGRHSPSQQFRRLTNRRHATQPRGQHSRIGTLRDPHLDFYGYFETARTKHQQQRLRFAEQLTGLEPARLAFAEPLCLSLLMTSYFASLLRQLRQVARPLREVLGVLRWRRQVAQRTASPSPITGSSSEGAR